MTEALATAGVGTMQVGIILWLWRYFKAREREEGKRRAALSARIDSMERKQDQLAPEVGRLRVSIDKLNGTIDRVHDFVTAHDVQIGRNTKDIEQRRQTCESRSTSLAGLETKVDALWHNRGKE